MKWVRWILPAAALASTLLSCSRGTGGKTSFPQAPVILISVDTLRSDHLPAYGYKSVDTPNLDTFRRDAILFEHAYSHYPLTLPSHTSILTGLLPSRHGVRDNIGYPVDTAKLPYLPRLLGSAGYATGGAISAIVLQGDTGLAKGFDFYDDAIEVKKDTPMGGLQRSGNETLSAVLAWLDKAQSKPFFLFFHIYEPHTPYNPPEPYASRYPVPYDGEIALADSILGRLFGELRNRGLYDKSVIVMLSDHGEGLGDHGELEHGIFLYRENLQIPLILKLPGSARGGETVAAAAQLTDVAPTILGLLGLPVPPEMSGLSLLQVDDQKPDRPIYSETYYPRLHMGWNDLASLIQGGFHYLEGPDPELYQLTRDPQERSNVLLQEKRTFAGLRDGIREFRTALAKPAEVDAATVAKMAALGYTGAPSNVAEGPLPDPKSQIHTLDDLKEATRLMGRKEWGKAIPLLQRMVQSNPRMEDAWERLALAFTRVGRRADAVEAYQKAFEVSGGATHIALGLATLLSELGRQAEAKRHAELALQASPGRAHQVLAEIALSGEDLVEAERQARQGAEADPDRPGALLTLASILSRRNQLPEAETTLARIEKLLAERKDKPPSGFYATRGDVRGRQGRAEEARRDFEEEMRLNPEVLDAYSRLAILLVSQGQPQAAWQTLQRMVEDNDNSPAAYVRAVETLRVLGDPGSAAQLLRHARSQYPGDARLRQLGG